MSEPRPKTLTMEMKTAAAREVAAELQRSKLIPDDFGEDAIKDIAENGTLYGDGYSLARALEDHRGWECDLQIAEALDSFSSHAQDELKNAQKAWAERNNIQPPLPNGTRVKLPSDETGVIDDVYGYGVAQFKIDGDKDAKPPHNARRIVYFEDAVAL